MQKNSDDAIGHDHHELVSLRKTRRQMFVSPSLSLDQPDVVPNTRNTLTPTQFILRTNLLALYYEQTY